MPAIGSRYLFFLTKPNISEPEYEVTIGGVYELRNGTFHPLDDLSLEFDNTPEAGFLARVQAAITGGRS